MSREENRLAATERWGCNASMGARVLVMHSRSPKSLDQITCALRARGVDVWAATTPGEVFWHLEGKEPRIDALIVDLDPDLPDRVELLRFLRGHRPLLRRVAIADQGPSPDDDCMRIAPGDLAGLAVVLGFDGLDTERTVVEPHRGS
jgi:hypothetical protein